MGKVAQVERKWERVSAPAATTLSGELTVLDATPARPPATRWPHGQGLTLVTFSAHRKRFLWVGGTFRNCSEVV